MQRDADDAASKLEYLSKHRQARELLSRSQSVPSVATSQSAARPPPVPSNSEEPSGHVPAAPAAYPGVASARAKGGGAGLLPRPSSRPQTAVGSRSTPSLEVPPNVAAAARRHFGTSAQASSGARLAARPLSASAVLRRVTTSAADEAAARRPDPVEEEEEAGHGDAGRTSSRPLESAPEERERADGGEAPTSPTAANSPQGPPRSARSEVPLNVRVAARKHFGSSAFASSTARCGFATGFVTPSSSSIAGAEGTGRASPLEGRTRRPLSAGAVLRKGPERVQSPGASGRPIARPSSACQQKETTDLRELPRQGRPLLPGAPGHPISRGPPPVLPPLPEELQAEVKAAPVTSDRSRLGEAAQALGTAAEESSGDFTEEELRLEGQVEQALRELEAADAAVTAFRAQLENAADSAESSRRQLEQLREVAANWERAAEEGRQELRERQQRVDELLAVIPPETTEDEAEAFNASQEAAAFARRQAARREAALLSSRIHVLESQTLRLEEQVALQQSTLRARMQERQTLERVVEQLEQDRDSKRAVQRESRASLRLMEEQLKAKEDTLATSSKNQQALERQALQLRGEAHGLRARMAQQQAASATAPPRAGASAPAKATAPQVRASSTEAAGTEAGTTPQQDHARAVSLQLQHQVVELWEAIRCCDMETERLLDELRLKEFANIEGPVVAARYAHDYEFDPTKE